MNTKSERMFKFIKYFAVSICIFVLYLIAVAVITFMCWQFDIPITNIPIMYYIVCVVGTSCNSFVFAMMSVSKGWLKGMIGGGVFLLSVYLFAFAICGGDVDSVKFLYKLPLFMLLSVSCGIFGINFRS